MILTDFLMRLEKGLEGMSLTYPPSFLQHFYHEITGTSGK